MKNKKSNMVFLVLFLIYCVYSSKFYIIESLSYFFDYYPRVIFVILFDIILFLSCSVILSFLCKGSVSYRFRIVRPLHFTFSLKFVIFICCLGVVTFYEFYINPDSIHRDFRLLSGLYVDKIDFNISLAIIYSLLISVFREIFFRGGLLSALEDICGSFWAIIFSSLGFAFIFSNRYTFITYLLIGIGLAFITVFTNSLIPAIISSIAFNLYYIILESVINKYVIIGVWDYIGYLNSFLFFLILYFILRDMERFIRNDNHSKIIIGSQIKYTNLLNVVFSIGFFVFILAIIVKNVFFSIY